MKTKQRKTPSVGKPKAPKPKVSKLTAARAILFPDADSAPLLVEVADFDAIRRLLGDCYVEPVKLPDGLTVWCDEDGRPKGLPLNRSIATRAPSSPNPAAFDFVVFRNGVVPPPPGAPAAYDIRGPFLVCRGNAGKLQSITDDDAQRFGVTP